MVSRLRKKLGKKLTAVQHDFSFEWIVRELEADAFSDYGHFCENGRGSPCISFAAACSHAQLMRPWAIRRSSSGPWPGRSECEMLSSLSS